ncbi:MAG: 4-alpha-glucanotransferase, partial [Clostridiales Family XIII bacterium]|nr:4-alpha-glucanotransferase [Clostridiales Family XIII bacterium]
MGMTNSARRAGILLPVTSLPSPYGIGSLGRAAYDFVDFLYAAGQSVWQILPVGPVGWGYSPYQPASAFAGNPWLIDLDVLARDGLLTKKEIREAWTGASRTGHGISPASAAYRIQEKLRGSLLEKAVSRFDEKSANYRRFCRENQSWLDLYVRFCGEDKAEQTRHVQYFFYKQWTELKAYANLKGIGIVGDLPYYVSANSADFLLGYRAFDVLPDGRPASSSGVPPDAFSPDGQMWDTPVYDWTKRKKEAYAFWEARLVHAARLYDGVRIDHFRGLSEYYAIPIEKGKAEWRPGPGKPFIDRIRAALPGFEIVAEDLGELSDEAKALVSYSGFPGMKILQFAFSGDADNPYLPHAIPRNSWVYTGTHDNDTIAGWARTAPKTTAAFAMDYLGASSRADLPAACIRAALASRADTCIIPMQDWLGLGAASRINKPASIGGRNWRWRLTPGALSPRLAARIRHLTKDL